MPEKTGIKGKVATPESLTDYLENLAIQSFSEWQRKFVIPGTRWRAPIYQGPDPREQYHPRGLLKQYIGTVSAKTLRGKEYITCGIPGATGRGTETDPDRTWVITQVLHRGWSRPAARTKPMRFAVWEHELQNPAVRTNPPEGIPEQSGVVWIFITFAKPQEHIQLNPFHTSVFEGEFENFMSILRENMTKKPQLKYREVRMMT